MSNPLPRPTPVRSNRVPAGLFATAGLAALLGAGAYGVGMVPPPGARATPLTLEAPLAMPSFADVVERVRPAVVSVRVEGAARAASGPGGAFGGPGAVPELSPDHPLYDFFRRFGEQEPRGRRGGPPPGRTPSSQGSGFFVSADGYLVTNHHVVEDAVTVEVLMDDGRTLEARVVGTDPRTDLAVVKVEDDGEGEGFPYVAFAGDRSRIGDWVVAIGNPFGLGGTVTAGIVSAEARDIGAGPYDEFIQIDAPINRGNSGGPTFNLRGEVVGVNTAIFSPSGGNVGIAFAIPAHVAETVTSQLRSDGEVTRGFLGVQVQPVTADIAAAIGLDDARGALIAQPQPGTPAADAGLLTGDVILSVDGREIEDHRDLTRRIAGIAPGTRVPVSVYRKGEVIDVDVRIGRLGT